jgi:hypothetical protein
MRSLESADVEDPKQFVRRLAQDVHLLLAVLPDRQVQSDDERRLEHVQQVHLIIGEMRLDDLIDVFGRGVVEFNADE